MSTATIPAVTIDGPVARVTFDRFDRESYPLFLATKRLPESTLAYDWQADRYVIETAARFAPLLGVQAPAPPVAPEPIADHLFDYQRWAVQMALDAKRFAIWADTGLGKGPMLLEWCRQVQLRTGGRVLILDRLAVIPQLVAEASRFYGGAMSIRILNGRDELREWCQHGPEPYAITNYEKFIPRAGEGEVLSELRYVSGLAADESSLLRTGGGTIKWALIKSARGIEYKLSATATPAPNEAMEYASQAAFLEKIRTEGDVLWTYFQSDRKTGTWYIKPHAKEAFYRFMASWSLYMRSPAAFGFHDILADLPPPVMDEVRVPITDEQRALMTDFAVRSGKGLFADERLGVVERAKFAQMARGFVYEGKTDRVVRPVHSRKPATVARLAMEHVAAGRQTLIWTSFDAEADIIQTAIDPREHDKVAILTGSQDHPERQRILEAFRAGDVHCLISKPDLIGYGLNLQFVRAMVFSGLDDSMERRYQAIRRAYRFGQTDPVHVTTVYVPELEGAMFENVAQKEARFFEEVAAQERHYRRALGMEGA